MTQRYSRWHPYSWPLGIKFFIGFAIGLAVVTLPALIFVRDGVLGITQESARTYLIDTNTRQANSVASALTEARALLTSFVSGAETHRTLSSLLLSNVRVTGGFTLPQTDAGTVAALMQNTLVNNTTSLFESARLLDRRGQVVASANFNATGDLNGADESNTLIFQSASAAAGRGEDILLSVTQSGAPVIEYVYVVRWRDGTVIGYLIARINTARVFLNNIRIDANIDNYFAETFVTDGRDVVLVPSSARVSALATLNTPIIGRALSGRAGYEVFTTADGEQHHAYYAPIPDTPLAIVTQLPSEAMEEAGLSFFQVRVFTILVGVLGLNIVLALMFSQLIVPSLTRIRRALRGLGTGSYDEPLPDIRRGDEIGILAGTLESTRAQIRSTIDDLETRLERRTRDMTATQEISRYAATELDLQRLLDRVVEAIVERFSNIYHAQVFLLDDDAQYAVLRASTGEPGRQLLARGHRLAVGSVSVIGQVTQQARVIIARDTAMNELHRANEFLPETRAELAVPLRVGEQVIGALDVQSKLSDAFTGQDATILQTMADQIAVAIQNARLYAESLRRVAEIEAINREETLRVWQQYMRDQRQAAITREAGANINLNGSAETLSQLRVAAINSGELVIGNRTERNTIPIAVPVRLRDQTLGAVEWEIPAATMSDDKLELARELANRLALSLDNARLFQESQRATERERLVNDIAAKITSQTSIDDILQTAVREVGQALRSPQVSIRLSSRNQDGNGNGA